ncbi:MAG: tetratricopeptide repeat protein [Deltaproteobacteria bacterium]|nr:tetratricopeptide repeat protein [Deltaproteobacteria bacterium]
MPSPTGRERFTQLVSGAEDALDLAEAALLIAQEEHPTLDVSVYLHKLDTLAAAVRARLPEAPTPSDIVLNLNVHLYREEGFRGNTSAYYDPANSFLNEVLDRKTGIPITLSVVYMEVGRRLGLPLVGVGFPGHFLVKYTGPEGEMVLDPFLGGIALDHQQLTHKLQTMYGEQNPFLSQIPQLLSPTSKKEILVRMLRNLKGVYLQKNDFPRVLSAIERILLIEPDVPVEIRDRGSVHQRLGHLQAALRDFQQYVTLAPRAEDAEAVRVMLKRMTAQLN